jgi:hypothetical protein
MNYEKPSPPETLETLAGILVNVLIRRFTEEKSENGDKET